MGVVAVVIVVAVVVVVTVVVVVVTAVVVAAAVICSYAKQLQKGQLYLMHGFVPTPYRKGSMCERLRHGSQS